MKRRSATRTSLREISLFLLMLSAGGCANLSPGAFPREMSDTFRSVGVAITDQAMFERLGAGVRGHVLNPGFEAGGRVEYVGFARLVGVDGDVSLEGDGHGVGAISDEARATIRELLKSRPDLIEKLLPAKNGE